MSRLDDELRKALRREQPSADFTQRLLERVALLPPPKQRWWHRIVVLLEPPKLRWVAIGVTASLLLAIGAAQYQQLTRVIDQDNSKQAANVNTPAPAADSSARPESPATPNRQDASPHSMQTNKRIVPYNVKHRVVIARIQKERELKAEGEAAKEKLMMALAIASSALSEAQRAVHDDGLQP